MHQPSSSFTPLAIVGMGCLFPRAQDRQSFWRVLRRGEDCITEVPDTHWSVAEYFDGDPDSPDRTYARVGGFLEAYPFDPTEFNLPPNTLEATDTSQLLGLVGAKAALEDAGYGPDGREVPKERTSVILGVTGTLELVIPLGARLGHPHWRRALLEAGLDEETASRIVTRIAESYVPWQENSFPGLLGNVVAGRIANRLDLHGTNCVVDAACASSLAAVHLAAMELQSGRSDLAITGGVDTFNDIFMFMCFSKTPALSPSGQIRPFSDDSDGTLLGEGVGMVVLKRLADAERDGDRVYAVLKGLGTSSDGAMQAIYAPYAPGQKRALERAYEDAGVEPRSVDLVEAHGTGTKVGDVVEFEALKAVYSASSEDRQWAALGSVKSQLGHTKAGAGAASLCKAALALHHKVLPPTLKVRRPNPKLGIEDSAFYLNTEARPWLTAPGRPRRAALSSFGFGGSNYHMVLEEHAAARQAPGWDGSVQILAASGATREAVAAKLEALAGRKAPAYAAHTSRQEFRRQDPWRVVIVAEPADASARLSAAAAALRAGKDLPADCFLGSPETALGGLAFLFPGQGSQYVGMGRELACVFPEPLAALDAAEAGAPPNQAGYPCAARVAWRIFPRPAFDDGTRAVQAADLTRTEVAQPALGATELGMLGVLSRFGVRPDAVAGHSYGELVALHAAGRIDTDTLFRLSYLRGRLMAEGDGGRGSMLAVSAPLDELQAVADQVGHGVVLANRNHPRQGVLSGPREMLAKAEELCAARGWTVRALQVSAAFHSPLMETAREPFAAALAEVAFEPARVAVYANATGLPYPEDAAGARQVLADQLLRPVDFVGIVERLYESGVRTFVEVGPKAVLGGLVRGTLGSREHRVLAVDGRGPSARSAEPGEARHRYSGLLELARVLAELAALGAEVRLDEWEEPASEPRPKKMEVPIVGANYRSPQSRPTPPLAEPKQPASGVERAVVKPTMPPAARPSAPAAPAAAPAPVVAPAPAPLAVVDAGALAEAFRSVQEGLAAMQALQQQTAAAHQRFLEGQAQVQQVFQNLIVGQQRLAEAAMGVAPQVPLAPRAPMPAPVVAAPAPVSTAPAPAPVPPPAPVAVVAAIVAPAPVASTNGTGAHQVAQGVLAVVAEKTGYPVEMLHLGMDIEADLGIDSIKRVEILASVEERLPGLSSITPDEIGALRTLQQVVDRLTPAAGSPSGNGHGHVAHVAPSRDVASAVLAVVAEKTGYPVEMLHLGMDIEADLGIDSIKRVEILASVEERLPGLSSITPDEIGSLRTLQQVVDRLTHAAPGEAAPNGNGFHGGDAFVPAGDVAGAVLAVVAEKTGYPVEMLHLGMDIEADLGIDSIKRVEILAAVEERLTQAALGYPGLSSITPDEIGTLRTLQQVVDRLAPDPGTPAPPAPATDVAGAVLAVVAEKTGYPLEMLHLGMDIEADLGIDSIKRVEILAAVEERLPGMRSITPDEIGTLRTLQQVVDRLSGDDPDRHPDGNGGGGLPVHAPGQNGTAAGHAAAVAPGGAQASLVERRVVRMQRTEAVADTGLAVDGEILVTDDGDLAAGLVEALRRRGASARIVSLSDAAQAASASLGGLVLLMPATREWTSDTEDLLKSAFRAAAAQAKALQAAGRAVFATVTRQDGAFGHAGGGADPAAGGLSGLPKVAAQEWPTVTCRALDVAPGWADAAEAVAAELATTGPLEVGLSPQGRVTPVLEPAPLEGRSVLPLDEGSVVLVTGGARGVTADCARALAAAARPVLVLLGRSPEPTPEPAEIAAATSSVELKAVLFRLGRAQTPADLERETRAILANREIQATLQELTDLGARPVYWPLDVRDAAAVQATVERARALGPIRGLIHAAGVLADRKIEDKTDAQFDSVFDTKVAGLRNLLAATAGDDLRFLAFFSSVTARFGRPGQSDYAMANEILNKVAHRESRVRPGCRVVALGWGPWDGGMVDASLRKEFEKIGVGLIPRDSGAASMVEELRRGSSDEVEVILGSGFADATVAAQPVEVFCRSLDLESNPVLKDHGLAGKPVLPMALMVEWLGEAAVRPTGLRLVGLDGLRVLRPVRVEDPVPVVRLLAGARTGDTVRVELRVGDTLHARAEALLAADYPAAPAAEPEAVAQEPFPHQGEAAYREYLFHGPALQGLGLIEGWSQKGLQALASRAPRPAEWLSQPPSERWHTDPLILDCALQAGLLWTGVAQDSPSLPLFGGRYRQYGEFPAQVRLVLQVTSSSRLRLAGDVLLLAEDGGLVAEWRGVEWAVDPSLKAAFNGSAAAR